MNLNLIIRKKNFDDIIIARQNEYVKNKIRRDVNFRLICNTRCRIQQVQKGNIKSSPNKDVLGLDDETYKKVIEFQMTAETNWSKSGIVHVKPISIFDAYRDEGVRKTFNWINTRPLSKKNSTSKKKTT